MKQSLLLFIIFLLPFGQIFAQNCKKIAPKEHIKYDVVWYATSYLNEDGKKVTKHKKEYFISESCAKDRSERMEENLNSTEVISNPNPVHPRTIGTETGYVCQPCLAGSKEGLIERRVGRWSVLVNSSTVEVNETFYTMRACALQCRDNVSAFWEVAVLEN